MAFLFEFTARQRPSLTASGTARNLAATSLYRCCEKVSLDVNVANKDSGISQKYAASGNWSRPHILWLREHELHSSIAALGPTKQRARPGRNPMLRSFLTLARERYLISTRRLSVTAYSFFLFFAVNFDMKRLVAIFCRSGRSSGRKQTSISDPAGSAGNVGSSGPHPIGTEPRLCV